MLVNYFGTLTECNFTLVQTDSVIYIKKINLRHYTVVERTRRGGFLHTKERRGSVKMFVL